MCTDVGKKGDCVVSYKVIQRVYYINQSNNQKVLSSKRRERSNIFKMTL